MKREWWWLPVFFLVCYAVAASAAVFQPGDWYQNLNRAPWNPADWVFGVVWSILYGLIAVAGWMIFCSRLLSLRVLWGAQLILNAAWSWVFFGQHWVLLGLIDLLILVVVVVSLILGCLKNNIKIGGVLLMPYALWLSLAASLNAYILINN